jgi:hypothetical protein
VLAASIIRPVITLMMEAATPLKCLQVSTILRGATAQKTAIFMFVLYLQCRIMSTWRFSELVVEIKYYFSVSWWLQVYLLGGRNYFELLQTFCYSIILCPNTFLLFFLVRYNMLQSKLMYIAFWKAFIVMVWSRNVNSWLLHGVLQLLRWHWGC